MNTLCRALAPRSVIPRFSAALVVACLLAIAGTPSHASADCGDEIDGARVACHCGDIVAASVRLQPGDPVLGEACVGDGLLVRPPVDGRALVLDLNGQEIRGAGSGAGILVLPGGATGVEIVGGVGDMRGALVGFREGLHAMADGALARVVNVTVRDSIATGVAVRGSGTTLDGVRVEGSGRDGLRTSGRSVALVGVEVQGSRRRGVEHRARRGVSDLTSRGNALADRLPRERASAPHVEDGSE